MEEKIKINLPKEWEKETKPLIAREYVFKDGHLQEEYDVKKDT